MHTHTHRHTRPPHPNPGGSIDTYKKRFSLRFPQEVGQEAGTLVLGLSGTARGSSQWIHLVQLGLIQHLEVLVLQVGVQLRAGLFAAGPARSSPEPAFPLGGGGRPWLQSPRQGCLDHAAGYHATDIAGEVRRRGQPAEGQLGVQLLLVRIQRGVCIHVQRYGAAAREARWGQAGQPDARVVVVVQQRGVGIYGGEVREVLGKRLLCVTVSVQI